MNSGFPEVREAVMGCGQTSEMKIIGQGSPVIMIYMMIVVTAVVTLSLPRATNTCTDTHDVASCDMIHTNAFENGTHIRKAEWQFTEKLEVHNHH